LIGYFNVEVAKYEATSYAENPDEGLRGASKMINDNLSVFGKIVERVRPLLHHAPALGEVLRVVVGGADLIAFVMGNLALDPIGMEGRCNRAEAMDSGAAVKPHPIHREKHGVVRHEAFAPGPSAQGE
jgi:hypothetical protein